MSGYQCTALYSYKGGTGRSMALANVACLLARQDVPGGVLMVDWDLEAPGLHRFFHDKLRKRFGDPVSGASQVDEHPGLMDLLLLLDRSVGEAKGTGEIDPETQTEQIVADIDLDLFVIETDISNLSLITAGCFNDGYSARINTFDWEGLYERSPYLYRTFAQWLAEHYRYVLIDSRTGFTDTSGICTMLIPEKLVVVFTPNR